MYTVMWLAPFVLTVEVFINLRVARAGGYITLLFLTVIPSVCSLAFRLLPVCGRCLCRDNRPLSKHSFNYQSFDYEESSLSLVGTAETLQDLLSGLAQSGDFLNGCCNWSSW